MGTEEIVKLTLLIAINPLDLTIPPSPLSNDRAPLPTTAVYTGSKQTPAIGTVKFGGLTVTHSAATYGSNLNVGDATCSIVGNGNYTGTKIFKWTITADTTTPGGAFNNDGKPTTKSFNEGVNYADADLGFTAKGAGATITYLYTKSGEASGIATRPTTPGEYTVTATVNDPNYGGEAAKATCALTIKDFTVTSITITPKSVDVANGTYMVDITTVLDKGYESGVGVIITGSDGIALTAPYRSETGGTGHPKTSFTNDSSALKFGVTYTFSSHIGEKKEYGDQTADVTATVVKFAVPTIQNDYSNQKFYGFETGSYSINDALPFDATAESRIDNSAYKATTVSIVRKGNNSTAKITKDSAAADKAITYDSVAQSLKVNVGSVEEVVGHIFDGMAYNPTPQLTIGGTVYTKDFTKTYKIKNGETYSTIEPANLINAGLYRVEYTGNTPEFNGIIYTKDFKIIKGSVDVGIDTAKPGQINSVEYGSFESPIGLIYSGLTVKDGIAHTGLGGKVIDGAFTVEFTPTDGQLSASNHLKAGDYTATVVFTPTDNNYDTMTFNNVPFTVTPKAIAGLVFEKTYEGAAAFEYSGAAITGVLASDLVTIKGDTTAKDAAVYAGAAFTVAGADATNYKFDEPKTLKITINQKGLTFKKIETAVIEKSYDNNTATGDALFIKTIHYSVEGLVSADENLTDNIVAGNGYSIVFGDSVITSSTTATVTITLPETFKNYKIDAGSVLAYTAKINGVTISEGDYIQAPAKPNEFGWYTQEVKFTPKDGVLIGTSLLSVGSTPLTATDRNVEDPFDFYLKYSDGKVAKVSISNLRIDTAKPTITTAGISQVENKEGGKTLGGDATAIANNTKENVKITIPYVEATSGIHNIVVKVDGVVYVAKEYTNNAVTNSLSFVVDKNGTYSVTLVDEAGNESAVE